MVQSQIAATPGGAMLQALRERRGKTQLWVEAEADLGTGYLHRVESGKVAQPSRSTLERILDVLDARYSERRDILERYGYRVAAPLPSEADREWAREISRRELSNVPFPAYVLDCTTRMVASNDHFARLIGLSPGDPFLTRLQERPMLELWFDPGSVLGRLVAEPDVFLPAMIRALRFEIQQFRSEDWSRRMVEDLLESLPLFRHYWSVVEAEEEVASATRVLAPVRLATPFAGELEFRLTAEPFTRDARFRLVYYLPGNPETMRLCAAWAAKD